jgi:hypothetical protein
MGREYIGFCHEMEQARRLMIDDWGNDRCEVAENVIPESGNPSVALRAEN